MKVVFSKEEENDSKVTSISVIDDEGKILEEANIYTEKSFDEFFPGLYNVDEKIFSMMNHIYNSGINNESLEFETKVKEKEDA